MHNQGSISLTDLHEKFWGLNLSQSNKLAKLKSMKSAPGLTHCFICFIKIKIIALHIFNSKIISCAYFTSSLLDPILVKKYIEFFYSRQSTL